MAAEIQTRNSRQRSNCCNFAMMPIRPETYFCFLVLVDIKISLPFPKRQILDSSKLKEFADDNFEFDENGRKFSKRVAHTVEKGEIARYEQFLLFPQCF